MKTLKQLRQEKKDAIREIFPMRAENAPLTDEEQDECLKEWLNQKRDAHCGGFSCDDKDCPEDSNENCQTCTIDELLEELNK